MKEDGKEWPERLEEIMRTIFCSLENDGKQSVTECKMWISFDPAFLLLNI